MTSEAPPPTLATTALRAGALAGLAVGVGDALFSWADLARFAPSFGGRLVVVAHVAALYATVGALTAAGARAVWRGLRDHTRLGGLLALLGDAHDDARSRDPRGALGPVSWAMAAVCTVGATLGGTFLFGVHLATTRNNQALVVAVVLLAAVVALGAALVLAFPVARPVEALLRRLAPARVASGLAHPAAPWLAATLMGALGAGAVGAATWDVLRQAPLRPFIVAVALVAALWPAWLVAAGPLRAPDRLHSPVRIPLHLAAVALLAAVAAGTAALPQVRKAVNNHSGLAAVITPRLGRAVDPGIGLPAGGAIDPRDPLTFLGFGPDRAFVEVPPGVPADFNVVLVTIDTLRADHVGAYGYERPTTPNLDALAADGALFVNAWAHAPSTRYSMPAILTGRHPSRVLWDHSMWWPAIEPANTTIGEIMKDAGFTTGAILDHGYFDARRRLGQGIDHYDVANGRLHSGRDPAKTRGTSSKPQADRAIGFLDRHGASRFFLWLHLYDPHYHYERHAGVPEFGDTPRDQYDHEIRFTDQHLGRVIDHLKAMGTYDRTVFVVTGDHGEGFGEHGVDFHGYHLYGPQTKVPMIVRVPGVPARRIETPMGHVDLLPTLANLVGGAAAPWMEGRSMLGEITGARPADGDGVVFQEVLFGGHDRRGAVTRCLHLLHNAIPDDTWELYDLCSDPDEERDVWGVLDAGDLPQRLLAWTAWTRLPPDDSTAARSRVLDAAPKPRVPIGASLGDKVRLLGVDVIPEKARRGDEVTVTWYWEAVEPLDPGWKVFVHVDGRGRRINADHVPGGGQLPLEGWEAGQVIADVHGVFVPSDAAPGRYWLYAGIFKGPDKLPIGDPGAGTVDGDGRLKAASFEVIRGAAR